MNDIQVTIVMVVKDDNSFAFPLTVVHGEVTREVDDQMKPRALAVLNEHLSLRGELPVTSLRAGRTAIEYTSRTLEVV